MDFVKDFLSAKGGDMLGALTGKLGFSTQQADSFLPAAAKKIFGLFSGGQLDLTALLGKDDSAGGMQNAISAITSQLDMNELASEAGVSADQAEKGVKEIAPSMIETVKEFGDPQELLESIAGDGIGDAVGSALGKLGGMFGKK